MRFSKGGSMTIEELRARKRALGYTNEIISKLSGVPLGTVQKIFSGATEHPRYDTLAALQKVLIPSVDRDKGGYRYDPANDFFVREGAEEYYPSSELSSELSKVPAKKISVPNWLVDDERWPNQGNYTIEDYYALPDDIRVELIDGVIYDMGAPTKVHQLLIGGLFLEFSKCISEHGEGCTVYFAPMDVRLDWDERTMVEPDLLVLCHEDNNEARIDGAPELTIEILSKSSRTKDCIIKLSKYMNAGVKEYWIVDPFKKKVFVYLFEKDDSPEVFSFDDTIPVGISGGKCEIDFSKVRDAAARYLK